MCRTLPPCGPCKERSIACHSECKKYIAWVKEKDSEKKKLYDARKADGIIGKHQAEIKIKENKRHRR